VTSSPNPIRVTSSTASEVIRVSLLPDSLLQETRDFVGGWRASNQIFLDEVRAIYTWEAPNWSTVMAGVLFGLLIALFAVIPNMSSVGLLLAVLLVGFCLVLGIWLRPRRWIRIESRIGPLVFHTRDERLLAALRSRIPPLDPGASAPPAPPSFELPPI
jgi:hypothetical protein